MKKYIIFFLVFLALCFSIPIFLTSQFKEKWKQVDNVKPLNENEIIQSTYDYSNYKTVKLLHKSTNKVEELPLDEYLYRGSKQ